MDHALLLVDFLVLEQAVFCTFYSKKKTKNKQTKDCSSTATV